MPPYKDLKAVCRDPKEICSAPSEQTGLENLDAFAAKWDAKYPVISKQWKAAWGDLKGFFQYPLEIRSRRSCLIRICISGSQRVLTGQPEAKHHK